LASGALADQVDMQNGDHYAGKVITLSSNYVVLQSEVLGIVKLPRAKVAAVTFGSGAAAKPAQPPPSAAILAEAVPNRATNQNPELARTLRRLGAHTNLINQVEDKYLKDAGPEAKAKFEELFGGLMSGKVDIQDIRAQASDAVNQIKALKRDGGEQASSLLDTYQAILEKFIKETTLSPASRATNAPPKP